MKKRMLSLSLALALVLGLSVPVASAAGSTGERGTLTYTEIIKPQYEDAGMFAENGLAAVKQNGKWGYINTEGEVIIPFQYEMAFMFNEGKAVVCLPASTDEYDDFGVPYYDVGFIDEQGSYTPFTANGVREQIWGGEWAQYGTNELFFYNGYALIAPVSNFEVATDGSLYGQDGTRLELLGEGENGWLPWMPTNRLNEGLIPAIQEATWCAGWVDESGNEVKSFDSWGVSDSNTYIAQTGPFNQGLAPVWQATYHPDTTETTYQIGIMDRSFQWVVQPRYTDYYYTGVYTTCTLFGSTGLAMVCEDGKWGAIDKTGKTVIPFQYEGLKQVSDGMIGFKLNGKYGYLDAATLEVAIPARYQEVTAFNNGLAVVYDGTKAYIIDKNGESVPGSQSIDMSTYFVWDEDDIPIVFAPEEYVVVQKNGKYGYGHVEYITLLPKTSDVSVWAYDLVVASIEEDLVPTSLQGLYHYDITRGDFCTMIIQTLETVLEEDIRDIVLERTGKPLSAFQTAYPFSDTTDTNIIAANALGIIAGQGDRTFDPYASITRQEAAAMLTRAAQVLGLDTSSVQDAGFADIDQVAYYFTDAVNYVCQIGVMNGTSDSSFSPLDTYTREQAYITSYRLFEAVTEPDAVTPDSTDTKVEPSEVQEEPEMIVPDETQEPAVPSVTLANGKPITDDNIREILYSLKADYPEGMSWTNDDGYYSEAVRMSGYGCAGFALICTDAVFGDLPDSARHSDFDAIRVGDALRINHNTHSVVVLEKRADSVIVTEGNYNSAIHWGREISRQSLINGEFFAISRYPVEG